jgi:DNA-binding PadR family transcriptional regulator
MPPLTPTVFHILLALADGERHGYAIMKQAEADSDGRVKMGPGTLYGSLKRMLDAGLVEECGPRIDADDERRVYYRIAPAGRAALAAEIQRYRSVAALVGGRALFRVPA